MIRGSAVVGCVFALLAGYAAALRGETTLDRDGRALLQSTTPPDGFVAFTGKTCANANIANFLSLVNGLRQSNSPVLPALTCKKSLSTQAYEFSQAACGNNAYPVNDGPKWSSEALNAALQRVFGLGYRSAAIVVHWNTAPRKNNGATAFNFLTKDSVPAAFKGDYADTGAGYFKCYDGRTMWTILFAK